MKQKDLTMINKSRVAKEGKTELQNLLNKIRIGKGEDEETTREKESSSRRSTSQPGQTREKDRWTNFLLDRSKRLWKQFKYSLP